jgi:hypothetical protein
MNKERIKELLKVCDEVSMGNCVFYKEKEGFVLYEDGLETAKLTNEQAVNKIIRLVELLGIKVVRGVIYSDDVIK